MTQNTASLNGSLNSPSGWIMRAIIESATQSIRYFVASMKEAAAHEGDRRQLYACMLQDIGLEPFDAHYGWRGSGH
ncbi:hypothetical protein [Microvirga sp. G4-2]|uniref:hypothetical protein n=1 Tax=Microvirga sp. G4-2 TaxID=3434467 RepID=UPI004044064D